MIAMILVHPHILLSLGGLLLAAEMLGGNGYCCGAAWRSDYRLNRLALTARLGMAGRAACGL